MFSTKGVAYLSAPNNSSNLSQPESTQEIKHLASADGVNSLEIVQIYGQTNNSSNTVTATAHTESDAGIVKRTSRARE